MPAASQVHPVPRRPAATPNTRCRNRPPCRSRVTTSVPSSDTASRTSWAAPPKVTISWSNPALRATSGWRRARSYHRYGRSCFGVPGGWSCRPPALCQLRHRFLSVRSCAAILGRERRPASQAAEPVVRAGQPEAFGGGTDGHRHAAHRVDGLLRAGRPAAATCSGYRSRRAAMSSAAIERAISAGVLAPMANPTGVCTRARSASESSSSFRIEAPRTLLATRPI